MGDVDVNLPGLPAAHFQFRLPYFKTILKEEYHIHITGMLHSLNILFKTELEDSKVLHLSLISIIRKEKKIFFLGRT